MFSFNLPIPLIPFNLAIIRSKDQTRHQRPFIRKAVRAVAPVNQRLLMVYSTKVGDYKFPGGGVKADENHHQALNRELQEETGRQLTSITSLLGTALELDILSKDQVSAFRMISYYYLCELDDQIHSQSLELYEQSLGFTPVWITPAEALWHNEQLASDSSIRLPFWLEREIKVLRLLIPILDNLERKP